MEGSPCGSPKYTPLQWKSEFFFLSYLSDFFFFSSLLVSTLETLRYLNCQGRGVACSPEYDSQIQKQKQNFKYYVQLTPSLYLQQTLYDELEFSEFEFGLHMESGKKIKENKVEKNKVKC